jgi:DUF4097 and DUF4098 domain-containing protein YvlB
VTIANVSGRHDVHGFSSTLRLTDVAGSLRAHTFSGDIRVQLAGSENEPALDLDTFSGDIEVRMPGNARGGVCSIPSAVETTCRSRSKLQPPQFARHPQRR